MKTSPAVPAFLLLLFFLAPALVAHADPGSISNEVNPPQTLGPGTGNTGGGTTLGPGTGNTGPAPGPSIYLLNPLSSGTNLQGFINNILDLIINTIGPIVVVFMVVYTGFLFVVAQGNSTKLEEARRMLLWTVVGALILLGAKAISLAIQATVQAIS